MGIEVSQSREQLRLSRSWPAILLLLAVAAFALVLLSGTVGGSIVGDQPPSSGDWTVKVDTVVTDETLTIDGNLSVEADLSIRGSVLNLDASSPGAIGINVTASGSLTVYNSTIQSASDEPYYFFVHGEMAMKDVILRDAFWGVQVRTGDTVTLDNVLLTDLHGSALQLEDADDTHIRDLRIYDDDYILRMGQTISTDNVNGFVELADSYPGLIVISGGSPRFEGIEISVNGTLVYRVTFNQYTTNGGITMDLEWPLVEVDTEDTISFEDIFVRESSFIIRCYVDHTQTAPQTTSTDITFGLIGIMFQNYRKASIIGFNFTSVERPYILLNLTSPLEIQNTSSMQDWGNRAVHAELDEEFKGVGPHSFDLEIRDIFLEDGTLLLHRMVPGYSGGSSPTFELDLLVDNVTTWGVDGPVRLVLEPSFTLFKTFDLDIRFSNCTFREGLGPAVDFSYRSGPVDRRSIDIVERTVFEYCEFLGINAETNGSVRVSTNVAAPSAFKSTLTISESVFRRNVGMLLNIYGSHSKPRDRLILENNTFKDNTCSGTERLMYVVNRPEILVIGNSFIDNQGTNGIFLYDAGGWWNVVSMMKDPCEFNITNNTFRGNEIFEDHSPPKAFIDIVWGGELVISGNEIAGTTSLFLNLSEYTEVSMDSTLDFVDNEVHENDFTVLYFSKNDKAHRDLEVFIRENDVYNNKGPMVDYLFDGDNLQYNDWGATFHLLDNEVRDAGSTVFSAYGNITVSDNTFTDCAGWVLRLEYLRVHRPYLTDNTFVRCGDAVLIKAKVDSMLPVLLWMDNNLIDTDGTALEFYYMEVTLRTTTVTGSPTRAVVADLSYVDAYDCDFEMDDCEVVVDGYIRMWYWVEAWVHWASKAGLATSNPVVDANVTFFDQAGMPSLTVFSDEEGHLVPFEVLAWHIEHSTAPVPKNPYVIWVSLSSYGSSVEQTINRSHKGDAALNLLLWDPEDPIVSIDSPEHMSVHNTLNLNISGFASDKCSGVHILTITIAGGTPQNATPDAEGNYLLEVKDIPEGVLEVRATIFDAGLNTMTVMITVEVDRTPPRLVVTHPSEDLFTNSTTVNIRGEVEAGTDLVVNMMEYATNTGLFDIVLPLNEGRNYFGLTATDRAGNTASVVIWVTRDTFDPELVLFGPAEGTYTNTTDIRVWGSASEYHTVTLTLHRRFTDIIDRPIIPDEADQFDVLAELEEGENEIIVTARDEAGNTVIARRTVVLDTTPPLLELVSPEDNVLLKYHQVMVFFTVSEDADQVYVNGKRVLGTGDLESVVMLGEGENPVTLRAIDLLYNVATISIIVHVDTVAPTMEITAPDTDHIMTNDPQIEVRGIAGDGELNGVTVTVDGEQATVTTDGSFYHLLSLAEDGVHQVEVIAMDLAGNMARASFTVDLDTEAPLMNLVFDPADDRVDPGTALLVQGAATGIPLTVTIVHETEDNRSEYSFLMINATFEHYLDLVDGKNTITVRSVDEYGNFNVTAPHVITVKERDVSEPTDSSRLYLLAAIMVAAAIIVVAYLLIRTPP